MFTFIIVLSSTIHIITIASADTIGASEKEGSVGASQLFEDDNRVFSFFCDFWNHCRTLLHSFFDSRHALTDEIHFLINEQSTTL